MSQLPFRAPFRGALHRFGVGYGRRFQLRKDGGLFAGFFSAHRLLGTALFRVFALDGLRQLQQELPKRAAAGEDIDALKANTAIAQLMIYVNALSDQGGATKAEYELLLQLLNPFAPHMTEELWQQLGHTEQLAYHAWPTYDEAKCVEQTIEIAVQVNGKVKARIKVPAAIENADAIAAAKAEPAVAEAIAGKTIAKEIYVKGKLVNIAVKG